MTIPTKDAIVRFGENEERVNTFVNEEGSYATSEGQSVETLPSFILRKDFEINQRYSTFNSRGNWLTSTAYAANDLVVNSDIAYVCLVSHTSGTFATDLAAKKWAVHQGATRQELAASTGSSLVGTKNDEAPSYLKTVSDILNGNEVCIDRFLPSNKIAAIRARTSDYDCATDVKNALLDFSNGGGIYAKFGKYYFSKDIVLLSGVTLRGDGNATEFWTNCDIEMIRSDFSTLETVAFGVEIRNLFLNKTFSGASTKYDIHLRNPEHCQIVRVRVKSGHDYTAYSATNVGGIFLNRPAGSGAPAFMNNIEKCWVQNNSIYFNNVTDSNIKGGYVWGHVREFAIRLAGGGANTIENVVGIICSREKGGIWLDGAGMNQIRIIGNEFDGNPLLDTGTGVYAPDSLHAATVQGNTFWGCDKHGMEIIDPVGWTVTGNNFWKCNAADNYYDDIRIVGKNFQPNGNTISGNSHVIDDARTKKGYAIREFNNGFNPIANTYGTSGVFGNYQNPAIKVLQTATVLGNSGVGTESVTQIPGKLGLDALALSTKALVSYNGYVELDIGSDEYMGTL